MFHLACYFINMTFNYSKLHESDEARITPCQESVITSGYVASCYLSDSKGKKGHKVGKIFCIGSESLMEELEMAGLSVVRNEVRQLPTMSNDFRFKLLVKLVVRIIC